MEGSRTDGTNLAASVKDALIAGLIALGLFGPIIGLVTVQNMSNQLVLQTRWWLVAIMVAIVIVGRFILSTVIWPRQAARKARPAPAVARAPSRLGQILSKMGGPALLGFVLVYPFLMLSIHG